MDCEEVRQAILECMLEGETIAPDSPLGTHLQRCSGCRLFRQAVAQVDAALFALPVEAAPAWIREQVLARIQPQQTGPFLPWNIWVPLLSLVLGLAWAYGAVVWSRSAELGPAILGWPAQLEAWLSAHQASLNALSLSVVLGVLLSLIGIALGLYVGRERRATAER